MDGKRLGAWVRFYLLPLVFCASALSACEDPNGPPPGGNFERAYAIATTLMANTPQATSLLFAAPALTEGTTIDYRQAVSVPDTVSLFGVEGSGRFYSTTAMTANVTRYEVDAQGRVRPGQVLSFAQFGIGSSYSTRSIIFASDTKAYLLDDTTLQAITFDPTAMTTGRAIDLRALRQDGYRTNFSYNVPTRGGQIVVAAFYYDATYSSAISETAVALIDQATDEVTILRDSRCGAFSTAALSANGDIYFGSDTYSVALRRVGGAAAAPPGCLLRMRAGANALDSEFFAQVTDLTGGQLGGGVVPGEGNSLWVRAFDESLFAVTPATSALHILAAPAWRWWRVDPSNPTAPAVASAFAPGAGEVRYFNVGGRAYAGNPNQDYTMTVLLDMTSSGAPVRGLTLRGQPSGVIKVR